MYYWRIQDVYLGLGGATLLWKRNTGAVRQKKISKDEKAKVSVRWCA